MPASKIGGKFFEARFVHETGCSWPMGKRSSASELRHILYDDYSDVSRTSIDTRGSVVYAQSRS